jgi:hypothetical protein
VYKEKRSYDEPDEILYEEFTSSAYKNVFNNYIFLSNINKMANAFSQSKKPSSNAVATQLMGIKGLGWGQNMKEAMRSIRSYVPLALYEEPSIKSFDSLTSLLNDNDKESTINLFNGPAVSRMYRLAPNALLEFLEIASGGVKIPFPLSIIMLKLKSTTGPQDADNKNPAYALFFHQDKLVATIRSEKNQFTGSLHGKNINTEWNALNSKYGPPSNILGISNISSGKVPTNSPSAITFLWPDDKGLSAIFDKYAYNYQKDGPNYQDNYPTAYKRFFSNKASNHSVINGNKIPRVIMLVKKW